MHEVPKLQPLRKQETQLDYSNTPVAETHTTRRW